MDTRKILHNLFEADETYKLLDITGHFLEVYFGHPEAEGAALMAAFFAQFGSRFNEDGVHHELPYRMAAIIHYLQSLKGDPDKLGHWMFETGTDKAPPEAMEYFRAHFFVR